MLDIIIAINLIALTSLIIVIGLFQIYMLNKLIERGEQNKVSERSELMVSTPPKPVLNTQPLVDPLPIYKHKQVEMPLPSSIKRPPRSQGGFGAHENSP